MRIMDIDITKITPPKVAATRCPVEATVSMIGGKWKPRILFKLTDNSYRYTELKRGLATVSDRMLTRSLREMELDGIVNRTVYAEVPVRVEYSLSDDGKTLLPILDAMVEWTAARQA